MFQSLLTRIPYLGRLYRGEIGLGWSFWLHFLIIGFYILPVGAAWTFLLVGGFVGALFDIGPLMVIPGGYSALQANIILGFVALGYFYVYIAAVGTWRSASAADAAHRREHDLRSWGAWLAKAAIIARLCAEAYYRLIYGGWIQTILDYI